MTQIKLSNYPYVTIFKIDKKEIDKIDFALCNQPKETLESYYKRQSKKPDLLINGGFFVMSSGDTIFTYRDENKTIVTDPEVLDGMGVKYNNKLEAGIYNTSFRDFINGYPVLVKNGQAVSTVIAKEIDYKARRSVLAYDDNYVYLIAVDSPGLNFNQLKVILLYLKVTDAINLDGGGSTRILKNGERVTSEIFSRPVDNVIAFYLKSSTVYRVQTGAFSKKEYAESYQKKIQALDDQIGAGYKNAYVRFIKNLYKVQVGAFSKQENAIRVLNDLNAKGYNAFITTE